MRHWQSPGWMAITIVWQLIEQKKGLDKGKGEGEFVIVFWLLFFNAG
jgi:hypothetical protein